MSLKVQNKWRPTAYETKVWIFDGRLSVLFILIVFFPAYWQTYAIIAIAVIFFAILNRFGYTVPNFMRWLGLKLAGGKALAKSEKSIRKNI